jgi:ribonuclease HI
MTAKPFPRPRPSLPQPVRTVPSFPSVAVKVAAAGAAYRYFATSGERSWHGVITAPTREVALLDIITTIHAEIGAGRPVRFLLTVPPHNRIWQHRSELATLGYLIERGTFQDQPLLTAVAAGLDATAPADPPAAKIPGVRPALTVATDGSVRKSCTGIGWLASNGRYGLRGARHPVSAIGPQAVLLAELGAIGDAVLSLSAHPLTLISDSTKAVAMVHQWMDGHDILPAGYPSTGKPGPLVAARHQIYTARGRLSCRWAKGHRGEPLNEGADALARLASRYVRGDSGLTESDYHHRAAGLAQGFSAAFDRQLGA